MTNTIAPPNPEAPRVVGQITPEQAQEIANATNETASQVVATHLGEVAGRGSYAWVEGTEDRPGYYVNVSPGDEGTAVREKAVAEIGLPEHAESAAHKSEVSDHALTPGEFKNLQKQAGVVRGSEPSPWAPPEGWQPSLTKPDEQEDATVLHGQGPIVVSKPGDPGHEQRVLEHQSAAAMGQAAANVRTGPTFVDSSDWTLRPEEARALRAQAAQAEEAERPKTTEENITQLEAEIADLTSGLDEETRQNLWQYASSHMGKKQAQREGNGRASIEFEMEKGTAYRALPKDAQKIAETYRHRFETLQNLFAKQADDIERTRKAAQK